jgi:hypothetical protein
LLQLLLLHVQLSHVVLVQHECVHVAEVAILGRWRGHQVVLRYSLRRWVEHIEDQVHLRAYSTRSTLR